MVKKMKSGNSGSFVVPGASEKQKKKCKECSPYHDVEVGEYEAHVRNVRRGANLRRQSGQRPAVSH